MQLGKIARVVQSPKRTQMEQHRAVAATGEAQPYSVPDLF